MEVRSYLQLSS